MSELEDLYLACLKKAGPPMCKVRDFDPPERVGSCGNTAAQSEAKAVRRKYRLEPKLVEAIRGSQEPIKRLARRLGVSRNVVRKYRRAA